MKTVFHLILPLLLLASAHGQDAGGHIRSTTRIMADGTQVALVTDPDKRTATETHSTHSGKVLKKILFTLDDIGATTGAIHFDAAGKIRYKEAYKRNGAGQIGATYFYSADDRLLGHRTFLYDQKGNPTQIDDFDSKGNLIRKATTPAPTKRRR
jgi:hypothetical protein